MLSLTAMHLIDPSTGLFEIAEISSVDRTWARISKIFNLTWLNKYLGPKQFLFNNGLEFKEHAIPLLMEFDTKPKPTLIIPNQTRL